MIKVVMHRHGDDRRRLVFYDEGRRVGAVLLEQYSATSLAAALRTGDVEVIDVTAGTQDTLVAPL